MSAAYIQMHFRLPLIMEANTILNTDQTVPGAAVHPKVVVMLSFFFICCSHYVYGLCA